MSTIDFYKKIIYIDNRCLVYLFVEVKLQQTCLFKIEKSSKKRVHSKTPNCSKPNKTQDDIKKWNTIKHVYRYQTLYKICEKLFLLTYNNQLSCLNYYSDTERDNDKNYTIMYAEIEETSALCLKERIKKHIELLRKVLSNDNTLEHDIKKIDSDCVTLFC